MSSTTLGSNGRAITGDLDLPLSSEGIADLYYRIDSARLSFAGSAPAWLRQRRCSPADGLLVNEAAELLPICHALLH